jgi:hypothetical protein
MGCNKKFMKLLLAAFLAAFTTTAAHGPAADQSQIHLLHKTLGGAVCSVFRPGTMIFGFADGYFGRGTAD